MKIAGARYGVLTRQTAGWRVDLHTGFMHDIGAA
jgi:hypothetical protein